MAGNFGAISVNNRLRELHERIDALEARIGDETPEIHAPVLETVTTSPETVTTNTAETVVVDPFDWKTSEDVAALKAFAFTDLGLTIKGNKKADTVRAEIEGFLQAQGA